MSAAATLEAPPAEALELHESVSLLEATHTVDPARFKPEPGSVFDADGRVPIIVIRPGIGRGRGRHLYEADMLAENAHKFAGWRQYVDHQSPEGKKAQGGLPRSVRDLGGRLTETWWDDRFPPDPEKGYGQGAVIGLSRPVPFIRDLIENDPEILEASIAASATGVRAVMRGGERVWLVEGINDRGSVDWVTEAGAGGRVAPLLEAAYAEEADVNRVLLESLSDEDFKTYLRDERPHLKLAEAREPDDDEGGAVTPITREALQEAISESPTILVEALQQSGEAQEFLRGLIEASIEQEREVIRAEVRAETQREIQLRDMRDAAHQIIEATTLPQTWREGLKSRFTLLEGGEPTDALDVVDEVDDAGKVVKPASTVLREAVEQEIQNEQARLREASPTRVRNQGPAASSTASRVPEGDRVKAKDTGWGRFLQENAGVDPDNAYAIRGAGDDA